VIAPPPLPVLLRAGLVAYRERVQEQLAAAGFDDLPRGGPYVLGAMANRGGGARDVIEQLGVSKQAASKLIDALVVRGYLDREVDPDDRRRLTLTVTARGRAAAGVVGRAVASVERELAGEIGRDAVDVLRRGLAALARPER
jgi:DNA-binding MarR family transcriptional regulator